MSATWESIAPLFDEAAALLPAERPAFLDARCGGDAALRREIESLLAQHDAAGDYLKPPDLSRSPALHGPAEGAVVAGFTLVRRIGSGGMGTVYEAQQASPLRRVALKFLPPLTSDAAFRRRFELEATHLGRMNHPSIAPVYETGVDGDTPYIAMELVEGALPITEYARRELAADESRVRLFRLVCAAVAHAHAKGVVHRDLKPGNVLVDESGRPRLIDFGIARAIDEAGGRAPGLTRAGDLLGTLEYLSPEQAANLGGGEVYPQSDVYALGLVLYEILCGRPARDLAGQSFTQAMQIVTEARLTPPREVRPDLPRELGWILGCALEADRTRRYASVQELDRDLERWLEHEPVQAGPRSRAYELRLWTRRHPTATAVLSVAAVSVVAVVALSLSTVARQREVFRLADAARLRDLEALADDLWPATPTEEPRMVAWLAEAQSLVGNLDEHRATLAAVRARALPWTDVEKAEDARSHPRAGELAKLERALEHAERARARRAGEEPDEVPAPDLAAYAGTDDGDALSELAWFAVAPDAEVPGDPAVALALAERALAMPGTDRAQALRAIAWACFAAGDDEEAGKAAADADGANADDAELGRSIAYLVAAIEWARSDDGRAETARAIEALEAEAAALRTRVHTRRTWTFDDESDTWWHERVAQLVHDLEEFSDRRIGLFTGISSRHGLGIETRLAFAREVEALSTRGHAAEWGAAITAVHADPRFPGVELRPQLGLVPLGPDPDSELQEFADVSSGTVPVRAADGRLAITEQSAVVFVLIPPGLALLGAQAGDRGALHFDPLANHDEGPTRRWQLDAFFLSKYELTQAQWMRSTGENPSVYPAGAAYPGETIDGLHPLEGATWSAMAEFLRRQGWRFPTEAQWEYAARAGTTTAWSTGDDVAQLQGFVNVADRHARAFGGPYDWKYEGAIDDGWRGHAPIGLYSPNAFGLHDMHGNVFERCADRLASRAAPMLPVDGKLLDGYDDRRIVRGGGFENSAHSARSAKRNADAPSQSSASSGLRPARAIER